MGRAYFSGVMFKKLIRQSSVANKSSEYIIGPFTYEYLHIDRHMTIIVDGALLLAVMDAPQGSKVTDDIAE